MSNLKPLVWEGAAMKNITHFEAQGAGIFYRINKIDGNHVVVWHDQTEGSSGNKELKSLDEAKAWVNTDHYPSKMRPYVKPSPTWVDASERLPQEDGLYLTLRKGFTFEMGNESDLVPKVSGWNGGRGCFDDDYGNVLFTHWMRLPELPVSKESDCE